MHTGREREREGENGKEVGYPSKGPVFASLAQPALVPISRETLKEICNRSTSEFKETLGLSRNQAPPNGGDVY